MIDFSGARRKRHIYESRLEQLANEGRIETEQYIFERILYVEKRA